MKRRLILQVIFFVMLILTSCSPNAQDILKGAYEKCQSISNGYYEMKKYLKLMSSNDTMLITQNTYFKKIGDDPNIPFIFYSHLHSPGNEDMNLAYTGENLTLYAISNGYTLSKDKEDEIWQLYTKNPAFSAYLPVTYNNSSPIPSSFSLSSDIAYVGFVKEELLMGTLCYRIKMITGPEYDSPILKDYIIQTEYEFWVNIQDSIPIQFTVSRDLEIGNARVNQFEKYILAKYEFNSLTEETLFALQSVPAHILLHEPDFTRREPLKIGDVAPSWSLISAKGDSLCLTDLRGDLFLLDFFYTSCPPCIEALPTLKNLYNEYRNKGLHVIGISPISNDTKEVLEYFIEKHGIAYPILLGNQDLNDAYKVSAYPTTYLISKEGNIIFQSVGSGSATQKKLEDIIQSYFRKSAMEY